MFLFFKLNFVFCIFNLLSFIILGFVFWIFVLIPTENGLLFNINEVRLATTSIKISLSWAVISICDAKAYISEVLVVRNTDRIRVQEPESKSSNFSTLLLHVWTWVGRGQKYVIVSVLAHASLYQRILSAGEMLTTRRVKYAQYHVGIGQSDTPLKRWIYSLINPSTKQSEKHSLRWYMYVD